MLWQRLPSVEVIQHPRPDSTANKWNKTHKLRCNGCQRELGSVMYVMSRGTDPESEPDKIAPKKMRVCWIGDSAKTAAVAVADCAVPVLSFQVHYLPTHVPTYLLTYLFTYSACLCRLALAAWWTRLAPIRPYSDGIGAGRSDCNGSEGVNPLHYRCTS